MARNFLALVGLFVILFGAALAAYAYHDAFDGTEPRRTQVDFGGLDLTTDKGRELLDRRLRRSLDMVCGRPDDERNLRLRSIIEDCRRDAWAGTRPQVAAAVARAQRRLAAPIQWPESPPRRVAAFGADNRALPVSDGVDQPQVPLDGSEPQRTARVDFTGLDLTTMAGRRLLNRRIRASLDTVCGRPDDERNLSLRSTIRACRRDAWAGTRPQVAAAVREAKRRLKWADRQDPTDMGYVGSID
ncbi:MAG: hypothetical protein B7Y45_04860 [Sphingomonas sp. 28-66-16]|nr:MAG: hypothetical protein B7Y45_04860 [Sphingomonas sp. 28-66-16]